MTSRSDEGQTALREPENVDEERPTLLLELPRCQAWTKLCQKEKCCDITLVIDDEERNAHKIVLACVSDFFDTMFTCGLKEAQFQNHPLRVPLQDASIRTLDIFLTLVNEGRAQARYEETLLLARAAHMYQAQDVLSAIAKSLSKVICMSNFVELWELSCLLNFEKLQNYVGSFANEAVVDICASVELSKAPASLFRAMVYPTPSEVCNKLRSIKVQLCTIADFCTCSITYLV